MWMRAGKGADLVPLVQREPGLRGVKPVSVSPRDKAEHAGCVSPGHREGAAES